MQVAEILEFVREIDKLKKIERQALCHNGGRRENSAEHSWHVAMTVFAYGSYAPKSFDMLKALKMALIHDVVEIDAGDTFLFSDQTGKHAAEEKTLVRLAALLPPETADEFKNIWHEYEAQQTPEAKFIGAIDRFLPLYSNSLNKGYSWKNHQVKADTVIAKCQPKIEAGFPELWTVASKIIDTAIKNKDLDTH